MNRNFRNFAATTLTIFCLGFPAHALVVNIDNFQVFKGQDANGDPISLMNDDFGDTVGLGLAGPMAEPLNDANGLGRYGLLNGLAQSEPGTGKRVLNTNLAPVVPSAATPGNFIQHTAASLLTNTDDASNPNGLKNDDLIKVVGIFDLVVPDRNTLYEIRLRDFNFGPGDDDLRLRVQTLSDGLSRVALSYRDAISNTNITLGSMALDDRHEQIMLILENSLNDMEAFTGLFQYIDGGSLVGLNPTSLGSQTFFHGEQWTRANFRAINVDVVPEPGAFALFGIGLVGLGLMRWRRKAA